jgi:hypothetical protein
MSSVSQLTQGNLLPFRIYNDGDILNWYSLDGTGLNGQLVSFETGSLLGGTGASGVGSIYSQNPEASFGNYVANPVGANYTNVISYRYQTSRKVRPSQWGDTIYNAVGFTLHTTATYDENLNPLANLPYDRVTERGYVLSGFAVPILTQGVITIRSQNYFGTPYPGYVGCVSSGGAVGSIDVVNPANLVYTSGTTGYSPWNVVGKFLSTSGVSFGGYAQFKVLL